MKKTIKSTAVLVLILALFASCSKFEDGPKISFRSIEKRIYGTYRIEHFSKNGTDLTDYWNQYYDLEFRIFRYDQSAYSYENYISVYGNIDSSGTWKHYESMYQFLGLTIDDKVEISLFNAVYDTSLYPDRILYPLLIDTLPVPRFTLTRLTNTEIWMEHTNGNDIYNVHLKE